VTLTGTPANMAASMAGTPAGVPGNFYVEIRPVCLFMECQCGLDRGLVSLASNGDTSIDTQPSIPKVRSNSRPKQIGGPSQVLQSQFNETALRRRDLLGLLAMLPSYADVLRLQHRISSALDVRPVTDNSST